MPTFNTRCCECEAHSLGHFFDKDVTEDVGFPDNKHNILQLSLTALQTIKVTVALELLHGTFCKFLILDFYAHNCDVYVHAQAA
jgi:hypothetical protein